MSLMQLITTNLHENWKRKILKDRCMRSTTGVIRRIRTLRSEFRTMSLLHTILLFIKLEIVIKYNLQEVNHNIYQYNRSVVTK